VNPSVTSGTSPTYTLTPLNSSSFTLAIIQPVQPLFILNLVQQGVPPEILLSLFVKEIDVPGSMGVTRYVNDPNQRGYVKRFTHLINEMMRNRLTMKAVDILEPVGPTFNLRTAAGESREWPTYHNPDNKWQHCSGPDPSKPSDQGSTTQANQTAAQAKNVDNQGKKADNKDNKDNKDCKTYTSTFSLPGPSADPQGFGLITSTGDAQYHVGNAPSNQGQLYRIYAGQMLMCVASPTLDGDHYIPPIHHSRPASIPSELYRPTSWIYPSFESLIYFTTLRPGEWMPNTPSGLITKVAANPSKGSNSGGLGQSAAPSSSPSGGGKSGGGSPGGSSSAPAANAGAAPPLQAPRFSALVSGDFCQRDQIILPPGFSESELSYDSKAFVHVYWRSLSEVFQYLGAILRENDGNQGHFKICLGTDWTIASEPPQGDRKTSCDEHLPETTLFALTKDGDSDLRVSYRGSTYGITRPEPPNSDFTRPILAIVSTLVNLAAQQNLSESSTPVRLLPLP
jgi:hypothetical protein